MKLQSTMRSGVAVGPFDGLDWWAEIALRGTGGGYHGHEFRSRDGSKHARRSAGCEAYASARNERGEAGFGSIVSLE